ncbi:MAG: 1-acyl-sn-glycerol-3-phosphate acyltransferase [Oscillospiraceae bacterium]|nr:1-acyl-sn-glycerol-3-phosphate acyltransferase [Oscillospiraceae bacterium]
MKQDRAHLRHVSFYYFIRPAVRLFLWLTFRYRTPEKVKDSGPFVMICNHVTDLDMLFTSCFFQHHMYYVASEHISRFGFLYRFLKRYFCPILRKKGTVAAATAMEMKRVVKKGWSIGLFAEGERSANGVNRPVIPSTGSLVRMLNCTLYTVRLHGGYFSSPRWGKGFRRGKVTIEVAGRYAPDQLRAMSGDEITTLIDRDIHVDAYADNARAQIAFRGKAPAEGIEHVLLACPCCGALNTISSSGSRFRCSCGMQGTYDDYGLLHGSGFSFASITEWSAWAKEHIAALPDVAQGTELCRDPDQILLRILPDHSTETVSKGTLILTESDIRVGEMRLSLSDMSACDLIAHGYLLISMKDGSYYELRNPDHLFSGQLYLLLIERYHPGIANL